jgi:hypothetical protein
MKTDYVLNASDLMSRNCTISVRVEGMWLVRLRIRCALPFIWLAAKIAGTGFEVER